MKKYIADALTALRFLTAVALIVLTAKDASPEWAFWTFVLGQLTDAFDGIAARKWPFPEGQAPRYRHYAELYDMVIDVSLGLAALAYVTFCVSWTVGLCLIGVILASGLATELVVWRQPFGAPQRCRPHCLWQRNQKSAETLVLLRRRLYLAAIGTVLVMMLIATSYGVFVKTSIVGAAVAIGLILVVLKKDRLTQVKTK